MSVKILLAAINSKYIHMNPAVYSLRTYALGSGALNTENAEIAIAEYTINQSMDEILGDLYERKARCDRIFLLYLELADDKGIDGRGEKAPAADGYLSGRPGGFL